MSRDRKNLNLFIVSIIIIVGLLVKYQYTNSQERAPYGVSGESQLAVDIGMEVLDKGGNAVDAAIAISYALSVVQPYGSGIGGGGAMLIYQQGEDPVFYDYLETAPISAESLPVKSGVPGFVEGMERISKDYGTKDLKVLMDPAIMLAENGFRADDVLSSMLYASRKKLLEYNAGDFFVNGEPVKKNTLIKQPELAETLKIIRQYGSESFYNGEIAKYIIDADVGLSAEDLSSYKVVKKNPVYGKYEQYKLISAPPPFSGIPLIQILQMSEKLGVKSVDKDQKQLFLFCDIVREVYYERGKNIADPNYVTINTKELLSKKNTNRMIEDMPDLQNTRKSEALNEDTTHFVVIDKNGMVVSCTNSLSSWFGTGQRVKGFYLNNHLKNFSSDKDSINSIKAGKRPRSFISPMIILKDDKPVVAIGAPGGNKIPIIMGQVTLDILENETDPQTAVDKPRFYLDGNKIHYEDGLYSGQSQTVSRYDLVMDNNYLDYGAVSCLLYDEKNNSIIGGADKRRGGVYRTKQPE